MINLSIEERKRFAAWLQQEATVDTLLLSQMEKMKLPDMFLADRRRTIQSYELVAKRLVDVEIQTI